MDENLRVVNTYPISSISTVGCKEPKRDKYHSSDHRLHCWTLKYKNEGMRRRVEGILVVHQHNHPSICVLRNKLEYSLPGGRLRPGEDEIEGLKRKLSNKLASNNPDFQPHWEIGECVGIWWRPNSDSMSYYPYCPPHITKPKECIKLFIVHLYKRERFEVARNVQVIFMPILELHKKAEVFGDILSSIPQLVSRFHFNMIQSSFLSVRNT